MLSYTAGDSIAHGLDPRSKIFAQFAIAVVAYSLSGSYSLLGLAVVVLGLLAIARLRPWRVLYAYRYVLPILVMAPLVAGLTVGRPWFRPDVSLAAGLGSVRVLLVVISSAFYVHTTAPRESRAAIQRSVPGKPGQFLGLGVGFVFRFLPLLAADLRRFREASKARLGDERSLPERMWRVAAMGLDRAFSRAETFGDALQARCLAWNPTEPDLSFQRPDYVLTALSGLVVALAIL